MRAPRWKLMICIRLERFVELPIIQASKRNSKLHSEMWMNVFFAEGPLGARARVRDASQSGLAVRASATKISKDSESPVRKCESPFDSLGRAMREEPAINQEG
jgi:hypothetical protein